MKKEKLLTNGWVVAIGAIISCALWGSAFPCIKIGYKLLNIAADDVSTQILFAGVRFTLAGVLSIVFESIIERRVLLPKKSSIGNILKLCMMQTVIQYLFFYVGLAHSSGVTGSIITGTNSLLTILIACFIFRQEKMTLPTMIGCVVGLAGVVVANLGEGSIGTQMHLNGEGFVFIAALFYAISSIYLKKYSQQDDPVMLSGYQFLVGGLILSVLGFATGGRLSGFTLQSSLLLLYLGFLSAMAYALWGILLKYNPVSRVAIYGFTNPVIGVLLSALLLGEGGQAFSAKNLLALLLVCTGIIVVNLWKKKAGEQKVPQAE
ncbi:DMT family transporter [Sellimonas catena]|uniref:Permease n=1 Tax=Sellimonas catena TaxID=2994035 RepID=A0A9W6CCC3_9FIRM|nr:DMT family transporter [Sellimonas catena]GLG88742.1 permease [Sellimonas catena]